MISFGFILLAACALTGATRPRLDGRIVGGREVDINDFPYQLSLRSWDYHICGASIISENWVLTASHCVDGAYASEISFRAGSSSSESGGSIHQATQIVMHPKYGSLDWDYALVQVEQPFEFGVGVQAVKLTEEEPAAGEVTVVSGWGTTSSGGSSPSILRAVDVNVVSRTKCEQAYGDITDRMICAADVGKDSCQGDSGGPLVSKATGKQVGVVSWGRGCASPGYPGVYSNIAAVKDWIQSVSNVSL